jgi:hypothetical protein
MVNHQLHPLARVSLRIIERKSTIASGCPWTTGASRIDNLYVRHGLPADLVQDDRPFDGRGSPLSYNGQERNH